MSEPTPPDRPRANHPPGRMIILTSTGADTEPAEPIVTPKSLLVTMRNRLRYYGSPLPEGYVPPPGIDIEALLKQVPWPPPPPAGG